jgi:hypothetical protein
MTYPCPLFFSEAEAKPNRGIDRVATEVAVRQSAIDLREHDPGVGIELLGKLPIGDERNGVERPMAVCERAELVQLTKCAKGRLVCVPKTLSELMTRWNRLSWRNDRAVVFRSGRPGLAIQIEVAA